MAGQVKPGVGSSRGGEFPTQCGEIDPAGSPLSEPANGRTPANEPGDVGDVRLQWFRRCGIARTSSHAS
jgi:hypothetical protein